MFAVQWATQTDRIRPDEDRTDTTSRSGRRKSPCFVPVREWDLLLFIMGHRNQFPFVLSLIRSLFTDGRNVQPEADPVIALHVRHFVADRIRHSNETLCRFKARYTSFHASKEALSHFFSLRFNPAKRSAAKYRKRSSGRSLRKVRFGQFAVQRFVLSSQT
jgi:hypothetical protein